MMVSTANQLRLQANRIRLAAAKATGAVTRRNVRGHAKPKQFKGPSYRRLRIKA